MNSANVGMETMGSGQGAATLNTARPLPSGSARETFYVTIEGTKQGKFKGEAVAKAHEAKIAAFAFHHEVVGPRDAATGQALGKRQHKPISFTKPTGAATPQILQALVTNEALKSVLFEFLRQTKDGMDEVFYTVRLTNASVTSFVQTSDDAEDDAVLRERVGLMFQNIVVEHKPSKTVAEDDW